MTQPENGEIARMFGRVEKQLDQISGKMDNHSEKLVEHGVRLSAVEDDVKEIKATESARTNHQVSWRQLVVTATLTVLGTAVGAYVVNIISAHH